MFDRQRFLAALRDEEEEALASSSGAGAAGPVRTTPGLLNIGTHDYFTAQKPFTDLMKSADIRWFNGGTATQVNVGADGWLTAFPTGTTYTSIIHVANVGGDNLRTGNYTVDWPPQAGLTVTMDTVAGMSAVSFNQGTGVGSFNLDTVTPTTQLTLRVANTSGGNLNISGIRVYYTSDQAALNGGQIFNSVFIANLVGASVVRFMDLFRVNTFGFNDVNGALTQIDFANFNTEASRSWHFLPPSVAAKLGAQTGKDIWISIPVLCTDACVQAIAAAIFANFPSGNVYVEYGNEVWNGAFPFSQSRNWLINTKSTTILGAIVDGNGTASTQPSDKAACAMADGAMMCWTRFETAFGGTARIKRVIAGQGAAIATNAGAFEYQSTAWYANVKVKTLVTHYAVAPYFKLATGGVVTDVSLRGLESQKAYNFSDSFWQTAMQNYVDTVSPTQTTNITAMQSKSGTCIYTSYEGGAEAMIIPESTNDMFNFTLDAVLNELVAGTNMPADISPYFDDGEILRSAFNANTFSTQLTAGTKPQVYVRRTTSSNPLTRLKVYKDLASYNADTPLPLDGTAGTYQFDNWTRFLALDTRIKGLLDGAVGRAVYAYAHAQAIVGKSSLAAQYVDVGNYQPGVQYGLKPSPWQADTPRAIWFRG